MQLLALQLLVDAEGPVGALSLTSTFRSAGIDVAEATAGRFLRHLDELGYTQSLGKRGRIVTKGGEARLAELVLTGNLAAHGARVTAAIESTDIDELIDLLHVRRAVEAEAAGLVALRATDEELDQIEKAAATHVNCVGHSHRLELSDNFHVLMSKYSHNRMLRAMTEMLLDPVHDPLAKLLDRISDDFGEVLNMALDHQAIARAVRKRDAALTEKLMREHIDKLIEIATRYRNRQKEANPQSPGC